MPVALAIERNTKEFRAALKRHHGKLKFTHVLASTKTAQKVRDAHKRIMPRVFDRPTRYTINALQMRPATKQKPQAVVGFKFFLSGGEGYHYLHPTVEGTQRRLKRFEQDFVSRGFMDRGQIAVPGSGARLNKYGNVSPGALRRMLSDIQAGSDAFQWRTAKSVKRNKNYRSERYFVAAKDSGLHPGVWIRRGRTLKPFLLFVDSVTYKRLYAFHTISERSATKHFPIEYRKAHDRIVRGLR